MKDFIFKQIMMNMTNESLFFLDLYIQQIRNISLSSYLASKKKGENQHVSVTSKTFDKKLINTFRFNFHEHQLARGNEELITIYEYII